MSFYQLYSNTSVIIPQYKIESSMEEFDLSLQTQDIKTV
jgi:hypothetical protein